MWKPDGAVLAYVDNRSTPVQPTTNGLVLHVQAGNGLLTGWFDNPESRASSTWQALKKADGKGSLYQFGDPDRDRMWAQADGNYSWASVETEGYPTEPLNDLQLDDVARIYAAGHLNEGWPFQLAEKPTDRGLGWHGMGGKAWGGHTGCPGDIRKAQRGEILRRAQAMVQGDDVPLTDADINKVWTTDQTKKGTIGGAKVLESPLDILTRVARNIEAVAALEKAQAGQVAAAVVAAQRAAGQPTVDVDALARAIVVELTKE